jgi:hypothetical protein
LTFAEIRDRVAGMVAEILTLMGGMSYESLMEMYFEELSFWHKKAVDVYKATHGVS